MHHSRLVSLYASIAAMMLASCSPIVDTRGHSMDDADLSQIVPNQSREDDVMALLGSPTTRSDFGDSTWYYIYEKKETTGMFAPEIVEQQVTAIRFNTDHTVAEITQVKKDAGKPVEFVNKTTPTEGHELGFFEQMLGNFGRFNSPGRSINPRDLGR